MKPAPGNNRLTDAIRLSTESLATVPSIVLGLFGMIIFVNTFKMGFSIIGGALTLMLLNLPVLVRVTEESIRTVPASYREASLALGAASGRRYGGWFCRMHYRALLRGLR